MPLSLSEFDAIIFDLGGVIVSIDSSEAVGALSKLFGSDAPGIYTQAKREGLFDSFERGELTGQEFRDALERIAGVSTPLDPSVFNQAWNAILGSIPEENLALLEELRKCKRNFLLSNTNEIHIEQFEKDYRERHAKRFGAWEALFEEVHYSHKLKMRKPEARIFKELLSRHQLDPFRTVFVDDNEANVNAAQALGIQSILHLSGELLTQHFAF